MKARPTIFLSGVSSEFGSFRDAVENEIEMKGCFAEDQPGFPPDYGTVEAMLRRKLHDADAVIHLVGFCFGLEPRDRPADRPQRSYTQMEFDIARELGKPVYLFFSANDTVRDPLRPGEPAEDTIALSLQRDHRAAIEGTDFLRYTFASKEELCRLAAEIPPVAGAGFRANISRKYAPAELIGREAELALLHDAWSQVARAGTPRTRVLTFVALGGEGKTSLVARWAADLAHRDWPGCDAVFAWSFYSQGTREQTQASSDTFLAEALKFFGDEETAHSSKHATEKAQTLARLIGERRALLIPDGVEPLQYAPASPTPGELKDQGIATLLKRLAADSHGLCVVTTRYSIPDLRAFWQNTAPEVKLRRLSREAGVHLLRTLGVQGAPHEFETLVEDVKGHALTLNLLGTYLRDAHGGDIRRRDLVRLAEADAEEQGGHAFRVMEAYERSLKSEGDKGKRALALLRLLGLFDRPATADCLGALLAAPAIPGLTEPLVGATAAQVNVALTRLESARLPSKVPGGDAMGHSPSVIRESLDAHPLLREYFAVQLKTKAPEAWKAGHRRLYEHLCASTHEGDAPTLEALQPLYQAVAHGCQAGLQQEALYKVFHARVRRRDENYSWTKLGAFGSDLGAIACFFEQPWRRVSSVLGENEQAWLLNEAAFCLRALGRLTEALEPMRAGVEGAVKLEDWNNAARYASNLSELEVTLGEVAQAERDAAQSVTYADRSGDADWQNFIRTRTTHADALHQAGRRAEAEARFREAEQMQAESQPDYPLLYSLAGFRYCDLLLTEAERAAWKICLESARVPRAGLGVPAETNFPEPSVSGTASSPPATRQEVRSGEDAGASTRDACAPRIASCRAVSERAAQTLKWAEMGGQGSLLDIALDHLTSGRAALYAALLTRSCGFQPPGEDERREDAAAPWETARRELDDAVTGLRRAGQQHYLPCGLLARAWLRFLEGKPTGSESAQSDLDEAWETAERGPMRLFLADIHLHRARLFFREAVYPWNKHPDGTPRGPQDDLVAAEKLIQHETTCENPDGTIAKAHYGRRDEELADAKRAILGS